MQRHISIGEEQQQQARSVDVEKGFDEKDVNISQQSGFTTQASVRNSVFGEQEFGPTAQNIIPSPNHRPRILRWVLRKSNAGMEIDISPPPDGGLKAWTVVILAHFVGFNIFGFLNAYGVLQTYYTSLLQLPPSDISWIGSIQAFLTLFVSAFSGRLSDAGYFHQTVCVGSIIQVLGVFTASVSTTYWQLLLSHGICVGLGGGIVLIPCLSVVGTYFVKRRPLALAICAIGNSAGGLVFAAILQNMIPNVGFAWAMRTVGIVMIAILVPANLVLKPRAIERKPAALFEWSAFKEPVYVFFAIGMFLSFLGQWVPVFYVSLILVIHVLHAIRFPSTGLAQSLIIIAGLFRPFHPPHSHHQLRLPHPDHQRCRHSWAHHSRSARLPFRAPESHGPALCFRRPSPLRLARCSRLRWDPDL